MRTVVLALILVLAAQGAVLADEVAVTSQMAMPYSSTRGTILGAQQNLMNTFGMNLALSDRVKVRDVYEVRRHDKKIAEAVVVFVSVNYSLLSLRGRPIEQPRSGDAAVYLRHADMPQAPQTLRNYQTVGISERDFAVHGSIPTGGFSGRLSFSPTFSIPNGVTVPGVSFGPTFSIPSGVTVSGPSFAPPNVSRP